MPLDLSHARDLTLALVPELLLLVGAMGLMLYAAWRPESAAHQRDVGLASMVVALVGAGGGHRGLGARHDGVRRASSRSTAFRWATDLVFLLATVIAIGLSLDYNAREGIDAAESHVLVLFATAGMMIMAAARDLMVLFLGIETMSIAVYVLAGLNRRSARAAEGALKYFLLGAFSTAFLLYGIALVYGATGSTNLEVIGQRVTGLVLGGEPMLLIGMACCSWGSGSRWRRLRSTCGRLTCTRGPRRRSPDTWRPR